MPNDGVSRSSSNSSGSNVHLANFAVSPCGMRRGAVGHRPQSRLDVPFVRRSRYRHASGDAGHWQRLGPWVVEVSDGTLDLTSRGGAANLSGIELWKLTETGANSD